MKTVHRAYSIFVVLILVLGVFAFPAQAPNPVHAEDVVPAEPVEEPTAEPTAIPPAEPTPDPTDLPPAAPAATAPASFSWDLTVNVTQEQIEALGSAEFDAFTKLTQSGVAYEIQDGTLKLSGTESLDQMRQAIFEDISPVVSFLGGQVKLNLTSPVKLDQGITVNLETRPATGFTWTLEPDETSANLTQNGDVVITQRSPGMGSSSFLSMNVASAEDGAGSLVVRYNRPFEKEINYTAFLNIYLSEFTPVVEVTDPIIETAAISVDETQVSPEEELEENPIEELELSTLALPSVFDWRNYSVVPGVRDQAACGSCFAFGTVGVMESAIKITGGPLPDLSEQFLVSCDNNGWNCIDGGLTGHAYHYDTLGINQSQVGAVLEADFPYTASDGTCTVAYNHPYRLSGWQFITGSEWTVPTVDQIKAAIWTYGPITAGVCAGSGWNTYSGGVFSTDETSSCGGGTNHQIILTGWDDSNQTWILRNSWGSGWGDGGYMHIKWNTSRVGEGTSWVKYGPGLVLPTGAPSLVQPVSGFISNNSSLIFNWNYADSRSQFQIQIDNSSTFSTPVVNFTTGMGVLSYTSGSLPGGTLYWRVRPVTFARTGSWSSVRSFTVDTTPPAKPNLLNPANGAGLSDTTPTLSVSAVTGAKYYEFQLDKAADFSTHSSSGYQTATSFTVPTAKALPFGKYYWRAQAKDAAGNESGLSDPRWFNVTILKTPANGSFTTNTKPSFTWAAVTGALQYKLQVATDIDFNSLVLDETGPPSTSYIHPTALDFNNYYWRMQVETAPGVWGDPTPANQFVVSPPPLPAPVLDSPANGSYTNSPHPLFMWNPVSGAHYELWVDRQSGFTAPVDVVVSDLFGTSATTPTPLADGKYYWKVRSINYLGMPGPWSSVRYVTIDTVAPPLPVLYTPLNGAAVLTNVPTLAVKYVTGAKYYQFQWDDNPGFSSPQESGLKTTTSYKLTTAQALPFGKVYWRAVSYDAAMNTSGATDSRWFNVTILKTPANGSYTTNTKPTFSWVAAPGAQIYMLQVDDNENFESTVFSSTIQAPSTSHTLSGPLAYGKYYWRMMVYTPAGDWSVYTPPNQFTVTPPLLKAPVLLSPASGAYTNDQYPDLSWNPVTDANPVTYEVWVDRQSGFTAPVDAIYTLMTAPSKEVQVALADGKYYWKVRTVNYLGIPGAWSSVRYFTVDTIAPPAPALSAPANNAPGIYFAPTFSWAAASGANAYQFEYDDSLAFDSVDFNSGTLTTRSIKPSSMGIGTWNWHVSSRDAAGNWGAWSAPRTIVILPPAVDDGGFEAGGANWFGYNSSVISGFSHGGNNSVMMIDYEADDLNYVFQQNIDMTYGLKYLHFWYIIDSVDDCYFDFAYVFVNGKLMKEYNLCFSNNSSNWVHQSIYIGAYANQVIDLDFVTSTNSSLYSDWYVDDVAIATSSTTPPNVMMANLMAAVPSRAELLSGGTVMQNADDEKMQQMRATLAEWVMRSRLWNVKVDRIK